MPWIGPVPRRPRCEHPHIPQHVIQRSAPGRSLFEGHCDVDLYLSLIGEACIKQGCDLHAYAFATHEVRLLITGRAEGAVTAMLHSSAQQFTRYANRRDRSLGTLWYGRYQSCLVGGAKYVLDACQLVEQSAKPAVADGSARHAPWSSYACHAHGQAVPWLTPHAAYVQLGMSESERQIRYRQRALGSSETGASLLRHTQQGCPWGSERFLQKLGRAMGELPSPRPRGRPRRVLGTMLKSLSLFFLTSWATVVQTP